MQVSQAEAQRVWDTVKITATPRTRQSGLEARGRLLDSSITVTRCWMPGKDCKVGFSKWSRILSEEVKTW